MIATFFIILGGTTGGLLLGTAILHALPHLGRPGRTISRALCRAPALDVVITYFTIAPLAAGPTVAGWLGLLAAVAGQLLTLLLWIAAHELAHPQARRGPRIVKVLNRIVGRWRNHAALWVMLPAVPGFWLVRMIQITIYPPLTWLVGLPKYRTGDWVNLSRQKFTGLVGHDLVWCLYCDWMTGLWSLGSEMLRNIESLWCPIRFDNAKKCEHCRIDFPDIHPHAAPEERSDEGAGIPHAAPEERSDEGAGIPPAWTPADGTMADVASLLERQYANVGTRGWFGHPARLTLNGRDIAVKR